MTSDNFEREPKVLPEDHFRADEGSMQGDNLAYGGDSSPGDDEAADTETSTNYLITGTPGNYGFVELTTVEEWREALGRPYFVAEDATSSDVVEMLSKVVRPEVNDGSCS